jgi:response regulator RpfG family c-di-GMP phosphodiesterase
MEVMKSHVQIGHDILMNEGYTFSAWIALTHHYYQKNSYPLVLPQKPVMFSHGTNLLVDFYARIVSIADHNDALKRRNDKFGTPDIKQSKAREIMFSTNPDQKYLIEYLYTEGVLT